MREIKRISSKKITYGNQKINIMQLSKHINTIISFVFLVAVLGLAFFSDQIDVTSNSSIKRNQASEKLYVALEEGGAIAVVDTKSNFKLGTIDLAEKRGDKKVSYSAHNVQVAPNGRSVWVTANFTSFAGHEESTNLEDEETEKEFSDQVIVINPQKDKIVQRIDIGVDQHLAHIVVSRDGNDVFVTAQEKGVVYKINGKTYEIEKTFPLAKDSQPHGLRLSVDDTQAFIALIGAKGVGVLDTKSNRLRTIPLSGSAIQTAVIPNSSYIAASVYDTKEVAFINTETNEVSYVKLPFGAEGAIQSYATPDGRYLYVADQGFYFEKPTSDYVYKIDVQTKQVISTIKAGVAPHGVVVSPNGKRAYITNLLSDDISVIDTTLDREITKIKVGKMPNGISLWSHQSGGTP